MHRHYRPTKLYRPQRFRGVVGRRPDRANCCQPFRWPRHGVRRTRHRSHPCPLHLPPPPRSGIFVIAYATHSYSDSVSQSVALSRCHPLPLGWECRRTTPWPCARASLGGAQYVLSGERGVPWTSRSPSPSKVTVLISAVVRSIPGKNVRRDEHVLEHRRTNGS